MPDVGDGLAVAQLIKKCPPLDLNSTYYYHILCRDFARTSCLAEAQGQRIGYVSALLRPESPQTLFVWQVAVDPEARGSGLAKEMLNFIVEQNGPLIRRVECTIGPDNQASQALFGSWARQWGAQLQREPFLPASELGPGHGPEDLFWFDLPSTRHPANPPDPPDP